MADILPEPSDTLPIPNPPKTQKKPKAKLPQSYRTIAILVGLVIIALLAILAGYIYDVVSNNGNDSTKKTDIVYIAGSLNDYYALNHYYPTLEQLNSSTFSAFSPSLNLSKFKAPGSDSSKLTSQPSTNSYSYQTIPQNCDNKAITCVGFKLSATLSNGKTYVITGPSKQSQPATI